MLVYSFSFVALPRGGNGEGYISGHLATKLTPEGLTYYYHSIIPSI